MWLKDFIHTLKTDRIKRIRLFTLLGFLYNIIWSTGKILFGIFSKAFFFSISGVHTLCIGIIKSIFFRHYQNADEKKELKVSTIMGLLIIISATTFIAYMVRLFFIEDESSYGTITSIAIAAFSFGDLGVGIHNFIKSLKEKDIMLIGLRSCNIVSGFYAIVLTQVAILSAMGENNSIANALGGTVFGICALLMGVMLLIRVGLRYRHTNHKNEELQNEQSLEEIDKH